MTIESTGPGGVTRSGGPRSPTTLVTRDTDLQYIRNTSTGAIEGLYDARTNTEAPIPTVQTDANGNTVLVGTDGVAIPRLRANPLRVALFGDSTANLGTTQGANEMGATTYSAAFPASGTTILKIDSDKWAAQHTYPLAWPVINCGISGDTTTQMLARDTAAAGATRKALTDLVNAYPDVVILRAGGVNDLLAMTAANTTVDLDAVYARHVEIVQKALASGAIIIDEGLYGYSPSSGTAADIAFRQAGIAYLNAKYSAFAATLPGWVYFLDMVGTLSNADGTFITGVYESTGVHLNDYGQRLAGNMEAALLGTIFGSSSSNRFDGVNVITNAMMNNTGAQSYGTVATGFTIGSSGAGSVRQNAKIEVIDNKIYQTCEYVWSTASQYGTIYAPFTPATMGFSANDVYGFEADIYIENMSGAAIPAPNNNAFSVEIVKTAAGTLAVQMLGAAYTLVAKGSNTYKAHLCIPLTIQEASAAIASGTFYLKWGTDTAGTFKLGMANPRIVKLGVARVTE